MSNKFLDKRIIKATLDVNPETIALSATTISTGDDSIAVSNEYTTGEIVTVANNVPTGTAEDTQYFVIAWKPGYIKLASSAANAIAGTAVNITATGSGNMVLGRKGFGAINLGQVIPDNAVITAAYIDVVTTFTSTGTDAATIGLGITGSANAFVTAIAISAAGNVWDEGIRGTLVNQVVMRTVAGDTAVLAKAATAGTLVKTTSDVYPIATIAADTLTAGKLNLYIEYILSE